jgi:hypothetical protein
VVLGATSAVAACSSSPEARAPSATATPAGRALRRLSRREYNNVVRDLLGDTTQPANQFGDEVYVNGFDNGSDGLTVQGTDVVSYQAAAEALAARAVSGNLPKLVGDCDGSLTAAACVDAFLSGFVKRAYRRPATSTEAARLRTVYAAGAASGGASGGFTGGIQLMVEAVLQSPAFLYREELGEQDPSLASNVVRLTDYEVATELSFLITGSMPDDALFAAVEAGALKTAADLRTQAARLIASSAAKPSFRSFLHQWMATDQISSLNKDATIYPAFSPAIAASMGGELDRYFDEVLWSGSGSLRELFTSTQSFVDPNLAALYGVAAPGGASGFAPVTLDGKTRRGVMTRAGFLAVHADTDSSGPVPRGVFVLDAILCAPPRPPPANVPPAPPPSVAIANHETTRERFEQHLTDPVCKTCHTVIDGVGFGFEEFDGVGIYRTTENGSPVDTSGTLVGTDVDGPFVGASALEDKLVTSQEVLGCFIKQAYRFAMGREESAGSAPLLEALGQGFTADSRVPGVFTALLGEPSFVLRTTMATSR